MSYSDLVPHDSLVRVDVTVSHEAMRHGHVAVEQRIRSEIVSRLSHWIYQRLDTTLRKAITHFHSPAHMHEGYRLELVVMTKTDFDAMLTKALQMSNPYVSMAGSQTWDQVFANDEPLDAPGSVDPLTMPAMYTEPLEKFGGFDFTKMWLDEGEKK